MWELQSHRGPGGAGDFIKHPNKWGKILVQSLLHNQIATHVLSSTLDNI